MRLLLLPAFALSLAACAPSAPRPADASAPGATATAAAPDIAVAAGHAAAHPGWPASPVVVGAFDASARYAPVEDVIARADALDGETVHVSGTIRQVCQVRGCWLTFSDARGQMLRVVTHGEDEADREDLTFPMDASGARAEVVGTLHVVTESVERRRHLAEDAGASADEIAAITEPSRALSLMVSGARITR